jgi:hypothetical protein
MSELLPPVRSDSASSSRRSDSRNSATVEEGLFGASSSAAGLLESAGRDGGACDDDDVSESPTMGEDFYKGVEGFLAKPAPTLRHFCKGPPPGGQSLPVLRKQRSDLRKGKVPGAAPAPKPQRRPRGDDGDHVDVAKVAEALQFCEGLAARDLAGGGGGGDPRGAPRRRSEAPREKQERRRDARRSKLAPARSSDDVSATYGVAPRGRRDRKPQRAEFSASSAKAARDPRRVAPGEVDALVRNFEEGTSLTELRKQLHASRKSMEDSASALRAAAADFRTGGAL